MQPTLCARCKKNVAVIFITKIENGVSQNQGLCLSCAREMHIKPVDDIISKMGLIQVSNATYAWGSSRFNTSSAWRCVGTYGNAGNSYYYNSSQAVASALLELPQAD